MTFMESVKTCFSKYFSYQGRAKRSEYWYFFLFCFLIAIAAIIFENIFLANYDSIYFSPISSFAELILFIPSINAATRRLHDVNKSGWWQLLYITGIGAFVVLFWLVSKEREEGNRYN